MAKDDVASQTPGVKVMGRMYNSADLSHVWNITDIRAQEPGEPARARLPQRTTPGVRGWETLCGHCQARQGVPRPKQRQTFWLVFEPQDSTLTSFFSLTPSQAHHDGHCLTITTSSPLHIPDGSNRPLAHAQQRNSCFACLLDTNDIFSLGTTKEMFVFECVWPI